MFDFLLFISYCADLVAVPRKQVPSYSKCKRGWFSLKMSSLKPSAEFLLLFFWQCRNLTCAL